MNSETMGALVAGFAEFLKRSSIHLEGWAAVVGLAILGTAAAHGTSCWKQVREAQIQLDREKLQIQKNTTEIATVLTVP